MELKRVVVTGLGAVTPIGNTPEETWKNALAGKSGAAEIKNFDTTLFKTHFACEVKDLNVTDFIDGRHKSLIQDSLSLNSAVNCLLSILFY